VHGLQTQVYDRTRDLDARRDLSDAQRRFRLRELGEMQRELVRIGRGILAELQSPGPAILPPAEPAEPAGETQDTGTSDSSVPEEMTETPE
jgi:hypothetical protein